MFNRALDSSDSILSTMHLNSRIWKRKQLCLPDAVKNLLLIPNVLKHYLRSTHHTEEVEKAELYWIGISETDEQQIYTRTIG